MKMFESSYMKSLICFASIYFSFFFYVLSMSTLWRSRSALKTRNCKLQLCPGEISWFVLCILGWIHKQCADVDASLSSVLVVHRGWHSQWTITTTLKMVSFKEEEKKMVKMLISNCSTLLCRTHHTHHTYKPDTYGPSTQPSKSKNSNTSVYHSNRLRRPKMVA